MISRLLSKYKNFANFIFFKTLGESILYLIPFFVAFYISVESFGAYSLLNMIALVFVSMFFSTTQAAVIHFSNKESFKDTMNIFILSSLAGMGFAVFILFLFKSQILNFVEYSNFNYIFFILYFLSFIVKNLLDTLYLCKNQKTELAFKSSLVGIFILIFFLFVAFFRSLDIDTILIVYFMSSLFYLCLSYKILKESFKFFSFYVNIKLFKSIFDWTIWNIFGFIALYLINWGDTIVVKLFLDLESVGFYNFAYQLFKGILGFLYLINVYYFSVFSAADSSKVIKNYLNNTKYIFLGFLSIFYLILLILFYLVINNFFSQYLESFKVFLFLMPGLFFSTIYVLYLPVLNSLKLYKKVQFVNILMVSLNLFLDFIFVNLFGLIGPAIATSFSYFVASAIFIYFGKKYVILKC